MVNGVGLIGLKVRANLPMPKVLILLPLVMMHWTVLVDLMTKIVQTVWDAVRKRIGN
jgi:PHP family Zn ribbon phosphoesterase